MNGNILRRRMAGGKDEGLTFKVEHPNYLMFNITTTGSGWWEWVFYGERPIKYFLDGEEKIGSSWMRYGDVYGQIFVPGGSHSIWVLPEVWSNASNVVRPGGAWNGSCYVGNYVRQFHTKDNAITTLYVNKTTPPSAPSKNNYKKLEHIYVPHEAVSAYKSAWTAWAGIIEGITFK